MWYEKYLSIPFEPNKSNMQSCDCAGLVFLVLQKELHMDLQRSLDDDFTARDKSELLAKYSHILQEIPKEEAREFDLFYQMNDAVFHIGVVVNSDTILETTLERGVKLNNLSRVLSKPTKFYRVVR